MKFILLLISIISGNFISLCSISGKRILKEIKSFYSFLFFFLICISQIPTLSNSSVNNNLYVVFLKKNQIIDKNFIGRIHKNSIQDVTWRFNRNRKRGILISGEVTGSTHLWSSSRFPYCCRSERVGGRIKYPYRKSGLRNCIATNRVATAASNFI